MSLTSIEKRVTTLNTTRASPVVKRIVGRELQRIRDRIMLRDGYSCRVCGRTTTDLEIDHVTPLGDGGAESDYNRQCLCYECHNEKTNHELIKKGLRY